MTITLPPRFIPIPIGIQYALTVPSVLKDFFGKLYGLAWETHYKYTPEIAFDDLLDLFGINKRMYQLYMQTLEGMSWLRSETHRNGCVRFHFAERFAIPSSPVTIQFAGEDVPGGALNAINCVYDHEVAFSAVVVEVVKDSSDSLTTTSTTSSLEESHISACKVLQAASNILGCPISGREQDYQPVEDLLAWIAYAYDTRGTITKTPGGLIFWVFHSGKGRMRLPDKYRSYTDFLPDSFLQEIGLSSSVAITTDISVSDRAISVDSTSESVDPVDAVDWSAPLRVRYGPIQPDPGGKNPEVIFATALDQLSLEINKGAFNTWVRHLRLVGYHDRAVILAAPNEFARQWVDGRLKSTLVRLFTGLFARQVQVEIVAPEVV